MDRFDRYEVVGLIGEGGMGRVYRARDTKLGRFVAIKVLPEELRTDAARLRRFEREARAVAASSHPNVLVVYDVGVADGAPYLVTELLEGGTVRERLAGGPLPVSKAVDVALQVARGLAVAHDKGVVHRDIKPSNLFVCDDGFVKILDFGIAKQQGGEPASGSGTVTTREGSAIGSVGYMSPEQVRGRAVDARSDVFSLGVVLYEMIAGQRPFGGDSDVEVAVATLQEDIPELGDPGLDAVVARCVAKDPGDRYASARELAADLEKLAAGGAAAVAPRVVPARTASRGNRRTRVVAAAVATFAVAGGAAAVLLSRSGERAGVAEPRAVRETRITSFPDPLWRQTVSRDGATMAYMLGGTGWYRPVAGGEPRLIPAPESWRTVAPVDFFPDGHRMLIMFSLDPATGDNGIAVVDLRDGAVREVLRAKAIGNICRLTADGSRIAYTAPDGIRTVLASGEDDRLLVGGGNNEAFDAMSWSPDGEHLAFIRITRTGASHSAGLFVATVDGARAQRLPTGNVLQMAAVVGVEWFDRDRIVYGQASERGGTGELWEIGMRGGSWDGRPARPRFRFPDYTIDHLRRGGDRLFVMGNKVTQDVYIAELDGAGALARPPYPVERFDALDVSFDVTPAGELLFTSTRNGRFDVYRRAFDGEAVLIPGTEHGEQPAACGDAVLFWRRGPAGWTLLRSPPGGGPATELRAYPPGFRPWLHCASQRPDRCVIAESDGLELALRRFDGTTGELGDVLHRRPLRELDPGVRVNADGSAALLVPRRNRPTLAIVALDDGGVRELALDGHEVLGMGATWMPGGGFVIAAFTPGMPFWFATVDATGATRELWRTEQPIATVPLPSLDGSRLAFTVELSDVDVFALDGV